MSRTNLTISALKFRLVVDICPDSNVAPQPSARHPSCRLAEVKEVKEVEEDPESVRDPQKAILLRLEFGRALCFL